MPNEVIRKALAFAVIYVVVSLGLEAALIVLLGWKVPQDNFRIAPCVLTIPRSWRLGWPAKRTMSGFTLWRTSCFADNSDHVHDLLDVLPRWLL